MSKYEQAKKIDFEESDFIKSSFSNNHPNHCVAIAKKEGIIAVRDTNDYTNTTLIFNEVEWAAFIKGVNAGEF